MSLGVSNLERDPTWAELLDIVERFARQEETIAELFWLRAHPTTWLMVTQYMLRRAQNHMAEARRAIKDIPVVDEATGRPRWEYLDAKRNMDKLHGKRLHFMAKLEEQTHEARYLIGTDHLEEDQRGRYVGILLEARRHLLTEMFDPVAALTLIEMTLVGLTGGEFEPDMYRPKQRNRDERRDDGD